MADQTLLVSSSIEEGNSTIQKDRMILLKLTEILLQNELINPEEKYRLIRLIRKDGNV